VRVVYKVDTNYKDFITVKWLSEWSNYLLDYPITIERYFEFNKEKFTLYCRQQESSWIFYLIDERLGIFKVIDELVLNKSAIKDVQIFAEKLLIEFLITQQQP